MARLPGKEDKSEYVKKTFNSIAKNYDLMNTLMSFGLDKSWRALTVKRAGLQTGGRGLDVCCGTGQLSMEQARVVGPAGSVVGLDFSENMLAVAQKAVANSEFKDRVEFIQGDAMHLPFEDNRFDCATVGWGLRNVPDTLTAVKEMVRVVKPGGKVVSLDMAQPTAPVFKQFYWLCFEKVVPAVGKFFSGDKAAYAYLHDSAKVFVSQQELAMLFKEAGLEETRYINLCGGVVAIVEGRKPVSK